MPEFEYTYKCVADDITDFPFHAIVPATLAPGEKAVSNKPVKHPHLQLVSRRQLPAPKNTRARSKPTPPRVPPEKVVPPPTEHPEPAPKETPQPAPREVR